ncbi:MAG: hypothetical protein IKD39_03250 [Oscillospiraceae bacterium]|nr:hypothetical protein [Oscillospiraceae bacterium]
MKLKIAILSVERFSPLKGTAFAGANSRGEGVSLAVIPPFLCAVKEMGVYSPISYCIFSFSEKVLIKIFYYGKLHITSDFKRRSKFEPYPKSKTAKIES